MQFRKIGKSEIKASVVVIGAWAIGGWMWGGTDREKSIRMIHAGLDQGMNMIDTAPMYGFGLSEELVGKAVKNRRDKVIIATKCGMVWDRENGDFFFNTDDKHPIESGTVKVFKYLGPESIRIEVEKSLQRLDTDYIDLYQTHWQDSTTAISDTMAMLLKLKDEGKIRAIGCSNASCSQMDEYQSAGQLDSDQEKFSMLTRKHLDENIPYCDKNQIAFLAFSPLANGLLTGKIGPDREFNEGDLRKDRPLFSIENRKKVQQMLNNLEPVTKDKDISITQLVIAWTVAQKGCTHVLVGARTEQQVTENALAGNISLNTEELQFIDKEVNKLVSKN